MVEYRSARGWAWAATFGLAVAATVHAFVASARAYVAVFAPDSQLGYDLSAGLGAVMDSLAYCAAGVVFIVWLRRSVANTLSLGTSVRLTTRDAALSWFVPLVNLIAPYRVVASVYRANETPEHDVAGDWVARMPKILPLWWTFWLATIFSRALGAPQDGSFRTRETATTWVSVAGVPFALIAALAAIAIVWSIENRQQVRARLAEAPDPAFEPPVHLRVPEDDDEADDEGVDH